MAETALSRPQEGRSLLAGRLRWIPLAYAVLSLLLAGYLASVIMQRGRYSTGLDGWFVDGLELAAAAFLLLRARLEDRRRAATVALGVAALCWTIGNLAYTVESLGGHLPPWPSPADVFYLGFYPATYVAIVLYARAEPGGLSSPSFLDGLVAGLGAAALTAAFAFHHLVLSTGTSAAAATTRLAFPIGDLLLVALVVASTVLLAGRRQTGWLLIAGGCSLTTAGDTFNLFAGSAAASSTLGHELYLVAWPTCLLLISVAVWIRPRAPKTGVERTSDLVLPGVFSAAGLAIIVVGSQQRIEPTALALATATLVAAGLRLGLSLHALRRITEHRQRQALTDDLTGLANRRHLSQVLERFFAEPEENGDRLAFLFLDLNHFKEVNDSFGHAAGDDVLRQLGPRLSPLLRPADLLVRLGGDELAVILIGADEPGAISVAERLTKAFDEPFLIGRVRARISASVGIALVPDHAEDPERLLRCADVAMYRAKLTHQPFEVYEPAIDDDANGMKLVDELRLAVAENQFVLHFQAQLDLRRGEVAAVEALVRWRHPRLGLIPPMKFLPLAEEAGLMPALTNLVLDAALAQCARWRSEGSRLTVAVNVSASNLLDPGFTSLVERLLVRHLLAPEALVLEITETSIISDYDRARVVVDELRQLGVMVSIDDFGAGFTSLAYLGDLAVGELKLDRAFITALAGDQRGRDHELVRSTISLGHALGLRVVAEGVEDPETLELLTGFGCDVVQGYLIAMPAAAEDEPHPEAAARRAEVAG